MSDERVLISLQHKKRQGRALHVVLSRSVTVRGFSLDDVDRRLRTAFKNEIERLAVGIYERPAEQVLAQLQHYTRAGAAGTLQYAGSRSMTLINVSLAAALRRIKAAFGAGK